MYLVHINSAKVLTLCLGRLPHVHLVINRVLHIDVLTYFLSFESIQNLHYASVSRSL